MARAASTFPHTAVQRPQQREKPWLTDAYKAYLLSAEWQTVREAALERSGHQCQRCWSPDLLHVHHLRYNRLGHEQPDDVVVLCAGCHDAEHRRLDSRRLASARLNGWAAKRWGVDWEDHIDIDVAEDAFDLWLERRGDG